MFYRFIIQYKKKDYYEIIYTNVTNELLNTNTIKSIEVNKHNRKCAILTVYTP